MAEPTDEPKPDPGSPTPDSRPGAQPKVDTPLRSVLGGWARRVGELVGEARGRPSVTEALREPLAHVRALRLAGDHAEALTRLRALAAEHPHDPFIAFSSGLALLQDLARGGRPLRALDDVTAELGEQLGRGPAQLLIGAKRLFEGKLEPALDELRRAMLGLDKLPRELEDEARLWLHMLAGMAWLERGNEGRALRELQKARARMPAAAGPPLRALLLKRGVGLALAADELDDADVWVRDVLLSDPDHRDALELQCRVYAAKGDRIAAHALLERLGADDSALDATRVWVGLTVGLPLESRLSLQQLALRQIQRAPESAAARRLWALAELDKHRRDPGATDPALVAPLLEALAECAREAPRVTRDRWLQELAHAALRLEAFEPVALEPVLRRLNSDGGTAPEELRLLRSREALRRGEPERRDFAEGDPPRFRADPDVGGPAGPDPQSPVRNAALRHAVLASHRALAAAELAIHDGHDELAQDLLVEALTHWPEQVTARRRLAALALPKAGERLEDLLTAATTVLAAVPNRVLGVSLEGAQEAMRRVIAARERLARPLTIAIMGEFSAGKSTFVNALLGEPVAPMGVLPTTTTINVFRRGPGGGARVHYRDGRVAIVSAEQVQAFLHGLDDTEAERIRHVEIERTGPRMGDAAVVDTPGLNALDEFHEQVAREFIDEADAVVWVFSATRGGAASEAGMLEELRASGRQVLGVLNKVDTLEANEQGELTEYLRQKLGEVLVDVVPLRGQQALAWRVAEQPSGDDPFDTVEHALDRHFLQRARELKRSLTARRLAEALTLAGEAVTTAAAALEARAAATTPRSGEVGAAVLLQRFADHLEQGLLDLDDTLTREGLGLGLLQTGRGLAKGPIDPLDAEYLEACLRDAAMAALKRALAEVARDEPVASTVLDQQFVPWARGYLEGIARTRWLPSLFDEHGGKVAQGETAVRTAFREALRPFAQVWTRTAKGLARAVEEARERARRESSSTPRAEALRLRTAVAASITTLRRAAEVQL